MIIDLSHPLNKFTTVYPGTPPPSFKQITSISKDGYAERSIKMTTHTGTHIDAPSHILKDGKSLDQFGLDQFIGPAMVIDCRGKEEIDIRFLQAHQKLIEAVEFVLFYTGWQDLWQTDGYFEGFPTLTNTATQWLIRFNLKAIGLDTISVDKMNDVSLVNHNILLNEDILIIENMCHLDKLISKSFELHCVPLRIEDADASPVRAYGVIS